MIHQILLLFFISPTIIHSQKSCPISSCSLIYNLQIQYPFKLPTDHPPPKECHDFINLRCDEQGKVVINLPSLGDFYVTSIDYVLRKIVLTDPGNCLLGRLMITYNFPYPLEAYYPNNYTYYTCLKERITPPFTGIHCLSNSVNATIATTVPLSEHTKEKNGCTPIGSWMIPVSDEYNVSGNIGDLQLTWTVPGCRPCYDQYDPYTDGYERKVAKFVKSPIFITSVSLLATFSGIACLLRVTAAIAADNTVENAATIESSATTSAAVAPPQATAGNTSSQVKNFSEVEPLGDRQGTLVSCSICLEEYNGKDKVRNLEQCGHYFHVECIDQWLQKNNTCPVCRTSLS